MKRDLVDLLCCPHCRDPLAAEDQRPASDTFTTGSLTCPSCGIVVPVERGFPFFTLADLSRRDAAALLGTVAQYQKYKERKFERGEIEMYAAFHPFNEALRATDALLGIFSRDLKPGDVILEPWARSGWTAAWLANRFPEQRVIALWEGNTSVLGYRGFAHWFASDRKPANLEVMFVHPDRGLPFPDDSVAAVFSHDCFHRFGIDTFGAELLRVAAPSAPIVLAHVHLSNSEPDPWFERGGTIRHGTTYSEWLERVTAGTARTGRIWSEGDLFGATQLPPDNPTMSHYNALILIAEGDGRAPAGPTLPAREERLLLNPLYKLHGGRSRAEIDPDHLDGLVGHMLIRHPVYRPRLGAEPLPLSDLDWLVIAAALCGTTIEQLPTAIGANRLQVEDRLKRLEQYDILLPVCASNETVSLQRFHANQLPSTNAFLDLGAPSLGSSVSGAGFSLAGEDLRQALELVGGALQGLDVGHGSRVQIGKSEDPLALLAMLAALALGADVELCGEADNLTLKSSGTASELVFCWDRGHDGFSALIEAASPAPLPLIGNRARIHFYSGEGPGIAAHQFLEAACSLRHSLARPHSVDRLASVPDWLIAVAGLLGGFEVRIG